jgi:hypothetical protein
MTLLIFLKPLITSGQHKITLGVSRKLCQIGVVQVHYENFCALHLCIMKLAKIFLQPWSDLRKLKITLDMGQCFFSGEKQPNFYFIKRAATCTKEKGGGRMMKVRWKTSGTRCDGPDCNASTVPICQPKP